MPDEPKPLRDDELCEWLVTYHNRPGQPPHRTSQVYTRAQAEAKFGPGWCEPDLSTRCQGGSVADAFVAIGHGKGWGSEAENPPARRPRDI